LSGEWLTVEGLVFIQGYTPKKTVIDFRTSSREYANNCTVSNCVIDTYNQTGNKISDHWVEIWGKENTVEHCYFGGKTNEGTTLVIWPNDSTSIRNNHRIHHNYFGYRPQLGINGGETIRIGTSDVCSNSSASIVEHNYFERCNGEVEIISNKSCDNRFLDNTFFECEGSLTLRHGNRAVVAGNWFIGNRKANTGGVRIINEGHQIYNNFFYQLRGKDFRSALTIMNAIPNSPPSGYAAVKNVTVANNTFFDCITPWNFCAGANERERTVKPESTLLINNLVYCLSDEEMLMKSDNIDGITLQNNLLINQKGINQALGSVEGKLQLGKLRNMEVACTNYPGKEISCITSDILKNRVEKSVIGAFLRLQEDEKFEYASETNCGPIWYKPKKSAE
jgi:poly(beta-D-mannuronate) lyase